MVRWRLCLTHLICSLQEQLAPTVGHETNTFSTHFSLKMVSTRSKVGVNKQVDAGPSGPAGITPDLAAILDNQAKMQQELADLKKRSATRWRRYDKRTLAWGERSKLIPTWRGKPRKPLKLQGLRPSSPRRRKANTTSLLTPSPPLNKHPFPLPNWGDNELRGKVTLVLDSSYLFSAGTKYYRMDPRNELFNLNLSVSLLAWV